MIKKLLAMLRDPVWQGIGTVAMLAPLVIAYLPSRGAGTSPSAEKSEVARPAASQGPGAKVAPPATAPAAPQVAAAPPVTAAPSAAAIVAPPGIPAQPTTPPAMSPPPLCAHVALPLKVGSLISTQDRICAIAACTSMEADAPSITAVREWFAMADAKARRTCDVADREALGDYAVMERLMAVISTPPTATRPTDQESCLDVRQALIDAITAANSRLQTDRVTRARCADKAQKETTDEVSALIGMLR